MFEGLDVVTIGMAIDRTQDLTFTEMSLTAKPDSKLAEQLKSESGLKTKFAGILNQDAAITFQARARSRNVSRARVIPHRLR